jgi:SAM-dependent methyltransferase
MDVQQNAARTVDVLGAIDAPLPAEVLRRGPFDLVLCTEVLEHVADWQTAFHNLAALLAPRGRLLITCPFFYPLHEQPYDFWRPTPHALKYWADRAGLDILHLEAAGDAWDVLGTVIGSCQARPARRNPLSFLLAKLLGLGRLGCFVVLRTRLLQRAVHLHSNMYLANVAVFERGRP